MRNTLTIAGKEVRVYLTTWMSYILFGGFILITGLVFGGAVEQFQTQSMEYLQHNYRQGLDMMNVTEGILAPLMYQMVFVLIFMLPVLTMRLFSEERRGKTLQLLMTAPIRPIEIVLGKYLGALTVMTIMFALSLIFPVLLHAFGISGADGLSPVDWSTVAVGYLGLFLFGSACVSIGLLASSVTESQLVAVIISFGALLVLWLIGLVSQGHTSGLQRVLYYASHVTHLDGFLRGMIRLTDVVYYCSLSFAGIFLSWRVIEAERWK